MAKINQILLSKLIDKTGLSQSRVYKLITDTANRLSLPRDLAAIALAQEKGIGVTRFASEDQLAAIRGSNRANPSMFSAPVAAAIVSHANRGTKKAAKKTAAKDSVFVVHGRNEELRKSLFSFLRSIGLKPLEWNTAIKATKKSSCLK